MVGTEVSSDMGLGVIGEPKDFLLRKESVDKHTLCNMSSALRLIDVLEMV